jgi:SHAQKYF class myb-like DNA-binding protein
MADSVRSSPHRHDSKDKEISNKTKEGMSSKDREKDDGYSGRWNKAEHDRFIEAIKKFGKDWKSVENYIQTRSGSQIRSHAQKFFNRIISKYKIDKSAVISFINNYYDGSMDNCSPEEHMPRKPKKKLEAQPKNGSDGMKSKPEAIESAMSLSKPPEESFQAEIKPPAAPTETTAPPQIRDARDPSSENSTNENRSLQSFDHETPSQQTGSKRI